jgi:DNA-binding NarL/FixJ family response regulator
LYALSLGVLLVVLRVVEYQYLVVHSTTDIYIALIALLFTCTGIWVGTKITKKPKKEVAGSAKSESHHISNIITTQPVPYTEFGISRREFEILKLIEQGFSNREIAGKLYLSISSVKTYTTRLFGKLEVQRRTQAVQKARQLGILGPNHRLEPLEIGQD